MKNNKIIMLCFYLLIPGFVFSQNAESLLKIQYRCAETTFSSNQIKPHICIVNNSNQVIELKDLKVRYIYTVENPVSQQLWIDYARIGSEKIKGEFIQAEGSDYYLEISFSQIAGQLEPGQDTGEIQLRFHKVNWTNYNQSDDYSFNPEFSSFSDFNKIFLYNKGVLVRGEQNKQAEWVPYYDNKAEIVLSENNNKETEIKVILSFPHNGFKVEDWESVSGQVVFSADVNVYRWTGVNTPVLTEITHTYNLGQLPGGNYAFQFNT